MRGKKTYRPVKKSPVNSEAPFQRDPESFLIKQEIENSPYIDFEQIARKGDNNIVPFNAHRNID